ncbi:glycoside hydrolase family 3 protein [Litorilituus lipolyticus]|nr:glycoside hydrolase family 3 protein [Litorilituus lipolyticus]
MTEKQQPIAFTLLDQMIAQKMALDIRYFCQQEDTPKHCWQGVTTLPDELAQLITDTNLGSVVLFAENFDTTEQVVKLTHDLQQAALKSSLKKPLIISVDQEGGRVFRFNKGTAFAGNMALGATYTQHQTYYTERVNHVIATELKALGISNNYAPVVDVNTNSQNPVINTRSYGEKPIEVAKHGVSAVKALQQHGIMATLKHFPGHGDTHVDSHLGLPRVDHPLNVIEKNDIFPFSWAIKQASPAMIMTAHIQYPALDDSTFTSKSGKTFIRPATMSRKILHDLLRTKMQFKGIIATDALDMAGIAHYFDKVQATVETFTAGADLAVMPFKVRKPSDVQAFKQFIKAVSKALETRIEQGEFTLAELEASVARINHHKESYITLPSVSLAKQIEQANNIIASSFHLELEQELADEATVLLKNEQGLIPLKQYSANINAKANADNHSNNNAALNIHVLVENQLEFEALTLAINEEFAIAKLAQPHITAVIATDKSSLMNKENNAALKRSDLFISTINVKTASLVDLGGMDDLVTVPTGKVASTSKESKLTYDKLVELALANAKAQQKPVVFIGRGSPYLMSPYSQHADVVLLGFDDRSFYHNNAAQSPGYNSAIGILLGNQQAQGKLPVSL